MPRRNRHESRRSVIYKIENLVNGKTYIGSTVDWRERFFEHRGDLRQNKHVNKYLQNAWNKYGEDSFVFSVIEDVLDVSKLVEREQYWMDKLKTHQRDFGYNISPTAGSLLGYKPTPETLEKLRRPRGKRSVPSSSKGVPRPSYLKLQLSIRSRYRWADPVFRQKMLAAFSKRVDPGFRPPFSEQHRKRISESKKAQGEFKGEKNPKAVLCSDDVRQIVRLIFDGASNKAIQSQFGISKGALQHIKMGRSWTDITDGTGLVEFCQSKKLKTLPVEVVAAIKLLIQPDPTLSLTAIAQRFDVALSTVSNIKSGKAYRDVAPALCYPETIPIQE